MTTRPELHVALRGDWGVANLYTICGWLAAGLRRRSAPDSTFVVHTGVGGVDNIDALLAGEVDFAMTTPDVTADMARCGRGLYDGNPHPELVAVATFPHRDRLALCISDAASDRWGLRTLRDLVTARPALRLGVPPNEPDHAMTYAIRRVLEAHDMTWEQLEAWGCELVEFEWPMPLLEQVADERLDGLFFEGIMVWHDVLAKRAMRFLHMDPGALAELHTAFGYRTAVLEHGELEGITEPTATLDFSQFLLLTRIDADAELVALAAQAIVEDRAVLEAKYRHLPLNRTPLLYPLDVGQLADTEPTPLHPAAAAYYRTLAEREPE